VRSALLAVGVVALLVRALYVWQISSAPFLALRIGDAEAYHDWALRIACGEWIGTDLFYQSPLYPYALAVLYTLNDDPLTVRVAQALVGALSCALLAGAGVSLFGRAGALAGLGLAIYPAAIFLDGTLDKSVLTTLFFTALLAAIVMEPGRRTLLRLAVAGALLGLLVLTRENALLLAAPVLVWIFRGSTTVASPRRAAAAFLAGVAIVLLPVGVRNLAVGGEFLLTTAQLGPNLYIGNHPGAGGSYEPLVAGHGSARDERADATRLAEEALGRPAGAGEVSRYWTSQAIAFATSQPSQWLRLTFRKAALAINDAEIADTESQSVYADASWLLRALAAFSFGVLLAAAAAGTVLTAHHWRRLWILHAIAATYIVSLMVFYVVARYRFPLVPVMLLLAAGGVAELANPLTRPRPRTIGVAALAGLAAAICSFQPYEHIGAARASHYAGIAERLSRSGDVNGGITLYQRALNELPGAPAAEFGLATALTRAGRPEEALPHFAAAARTWPDLAEVRYNFGLALQRAGKTEAAIGELDAAIRARPDDADARLAMGRTLLGAARPVEAVEHYRRVLDRHPRHVTALAGLGIALTQSGGLAEALRAYRTALEIDPADADVHNNLGWSLASVGRVEEAIPHFERAIALNPGHDSARLNLERARSLIKERMPSRNGYR
jgi:tetratricopeptide (TPR) repeat protein